VKRAIALLAVLAALAPWVGGPRAADLETRYRDAAARFHTLEQTGQKANGAVNADAWRTLADQFRSIYTDVPDSRRGADALYSAGLSYRQAWEVSAEWRDLSRAVAQFREFTARFPKDTLADDALMHLAWLQAKGFDDAQGAVDLYHRLLAAYPDGDQRDAARLALADAQRTLAAAQQRQHDAAQAAASAQAPAAQAAASAQAPAAAAAPAATVAAAVQPRPRAAGTPETRSTPAAKAAPAATAVAGSSAAAAASTGAGNADARPELAALAAAAVTSGDEGTPQGGRIKRIQFWTTPELTRVIVTTDPGVRYTVNRIPGDAKHPERVYFDLHGQPADALPDLTPVGDPVLRQIRVGQSGGNATRVVLDLRHLHGYEVKDFRLPTERKIVVDLHPTAELVAAARRQQARAVAAVQSPAPAPLPQRVPATATQATPQTVPATVPATNKLPPEPQLASLPAVLQVHSIMIDPGHGGKDPGAIAFGLEEKNLTLSIARDLRAVLQKRHPELRVGMTRDSDVFIPLQERPEIAKRFGADLFVSIHVNANPIKRFHGVETYFLNLTDDRHALEVAARENETSQQSTNALNDILLDLMRDTTLIQSSALAKAVQASLVGTLRGDRGAVHDLGVKQAPFLVLMGAEMPSVLVEVGFITNRQENQRLQDPQHLNQIAEGIYDGLGRYIEQQNVVAARRREPSVAANDRR
jgi:N-acetylmuramoyl-L-alanine amidase